ncbi:DUF2271 domain-containing protein [Oryzibacter oryziterrae]|uniref:DUF2271 domain-containing protein n=1 Tax=Oryzibacter oryziterrae TaxID=2766474 RepID=UPI001F16027B|nr:DUF2271 domain-containing protein [Oryzibacter oryziterrae]
MNPTPIALGLAAAFVLPTIAEARSVTLTTTIKSYWGNNAYMAIYVTDAQGNLKSTLDLSGSRGKYFRHLRDWTRARAHGPTGVDGVTGASVGPGKTLKVKVDVADALIDAGYEIHIDTAAEDGNDFPSDVVVPLTSASAGKAVSGAGYVSAFQFDM